METSRRLWSLALAVVLAVGVAFAFNALASGKAYADESDVRGTSTGVMKFNWSIDNNEYSRGSCFLINEDHVLTAYHCTMFSTTDLVTYGYDGLSTQELRDRMTYSVTINRDVTVGATIVNYSEDQDFAILKLDQKINNHDPLVLRDSSTVQAAEQAFSVGFPAAADVAHPITTYTAQDVTIKGGTVSKPETIVTLTDIIEDYAFVTSNRSGYYVQTDVNVTGGDSGGPLVDGNGNVIGVNVMTIRNFSYGSATDIIMPILDDLGIEYTAASESGSAIGGTGESSNSSSSASASSASAQSSEGSASASSESASSESASTSGEGEKASKDQGLPTAAIVGIVVAIVAIIAIIVIVLVMRSRKNGAQTAPTVPLAGSQAPASAPAPQPALQPSDSTFAETTILDDDANDTVILFQAASGGSLTRMSTNEQIPINSAEFSIGRERSKVNYCLEGNTSISRVHVRFVVRDGKVYLVDNKAANGTFVNGVKCQPGQEVLLKSGDIITLADEKFKYNS